MSKTVGGERVKLGEVLPLEQPFVVQIFPAYACNLKCEYCIHSLDKSMHDYISTEIFMDLDIYKKCIDDMTDFSYKIKMLRFAAIGEPLLHKDIAEMIVYAKSKNVADSVDIVTNATLLNQSLSDALIDAGLDRLRISIEGLTGAEYEKNCGKKIDFEKLVSEIKYFYEHSKTTKVYIKIIDYMVKDDSQKKQFYDIFSSICHEIAVEHLTPTIEEIDYIEIAGNSEINKPQNGEILLNTQICPQPFYLMQINPDGNVVPCCSMKYPCVLGNVKQDTLKDIWHSKKYNGFRRQLLDGVSSAGAVCSRCNLYIYGTHEADMLDEYAEKLKDVYKN